MATVDGRLGWWDSSGRRPAPPSTHGQGRDRPGACLGGTSAFPAGVGELAPADGSAQRRSSKWDVQC